MNKARDLFRPFLPRFITILVLCLLMTSFHLDEKTKKVLKNAEFNEKCLKCHGQSRYSYANTETGDKIFRRMYSEAIINRDLFYESNHRQFKCTDCHSEDYDTFPHPGRLRMESKYTCNDCHGDDPKYEKFKFMQIEEEFLSSVHATKHSDDFTCWMCHNPHTYKISARTEDKVKGIVAYDNAICLDCHGNINRYQLLVDIENPDIVQKHDWLPNQKLHFGNVRCIECHATVNDFLLVSHNIQPKAKAVKLCVECHSTNSRLLASLYKFKVKEHRKKAGFFNSEMMNESFVIGANRNYYLGIACIIMFCLVIAGISIHATLRILKKKTDG